MDQLLVLHVASYSTSVAGRPSPQVIAKSSLVALWPNGLMTL